MPSRREPRWVSGLLSAAYPGAGHFVQGRKIAGTFYMGIYTAALLIFLFYFSRAVWMWCHGRHEEADWMLVLYIAIIKVAIFTLSILDSMRSACIGKP